jgi:hypothetical protein
VVTVADLTWPPRPWTDDPPADHHYASALWLCGRSRQLTKLVERVPGAIRSDDDGSRFLDLDWLAEALAALDAHTAAWEDYRRRTYEPSDDAAWEAWERRGPQHTHPAAHSIGVMSRTEVSRLRLLAFFASDGARLRAHDMTGLDAAGQELLADWCRAVLAA